MGESTLGHRPSLFRRRSACRVVPESSFREPPTRSNVTTSVQAYDKVAAVLSFQVRNLTKKLRCDVDGVSYLGTSSVTVDFRCSKRPAFEADGDQMEVLYVGTSGHYVFAPAPTPSPGSPLAMPETPLVASFVEAPSTAP